MCAPKAPNATQTAGAQTNSNIQTALAQTYLNQTNQRSPWGSVTTEQTGTSQIRMPDGSTIDIPRFTQSTRLSGNQQNLLNVQEGVQQQMLNLSSQRGTALAKTLKGSINQPSYNEFKAGPNLQTRIAGAGSIQNGYDTGGPIQTQLNNQDTWGRVQDVENAMFQRYNPQLEQDRQRMETQLANQGVRVGSDAYKNAMNIQNQNVNDARLGITINAGQEQNRLQQLEMNSGNFANQAQAQQYGQNAGLAAFQNAAQQQRYGQNANNAAFGNAAMQQGWQNNFNVNQANNGLKDSRFANTLATRNQLLNEQSALMNGQQVGMPQFGNTPQTQVGGTDVASLINQQYQQQLAQNNNMWGGIGQLAAGAFRLSDERAKDNIEKLGSMAEGVGIYSYNYKGDDTPQVGVLAQEAEKVVPEAVRTRPDGLKEVNYPRLTMALGVK